jgi:hypothetical protein
VKREDLVEFSRRPRGGVDETRAEYWMSFTQSHGPAAALRIADELRRYVQLLRPDWPTAEDRAADLATHMRLSDAFRRVRLNRTR